MLGVTRSYWSCYTEETLTAVVCLAGRGQRQEKWVKPCSFTLPVVRGDYNCNAYCNCFDIFHTRFLWAGMCRPWGGVVVLLQHCWAWHVRSPVEKQGNGASRNPETFWLHLKAKGRLETDYKFGIVTFCLSKTTPKKHKLSHANVGGKKNWILTVNSIA